MYGVAYNKLSAAVIIVMVRTQHVSRTLAVTWDMHAPSPQAKFGCPDEATLSPSKLRLLSEKAMNSDLLKPCNDEFKRGLK